MSRSRKTSSDIERQIWRQAIQREVAPTHFLHFHATRHVLESDFYRWKSSVEVRLGSVMKMKTLVTRYFGVLQEAPESKRIHLHAFVHIPNWRFELEPKVMDAMSGAWVQIMRNVNVFASDRRQVVEPFDRFRGGIEYALRDLHVEFVHLEGSPIICHPGFRFEEDEFSVLHHPSETSTFTSGAPMT